MKVQPLSTAFFTRRPGAFRIILLLLVGISVQAANATQAWYTHYYVNPQPDKIVEQIRAMSKANTLSQAEDPTILIAFFSRVMAQNPQKISEWMKELKSLPPPDTRILYSAIWFSNTPEGKAFFKQNNLPGYLTKEPPDILKMQPDSPATIDMLWGYFMATGDPAAIRRIVSALNLNKYSNAFKGYKNSQKTDEDKKAAYLSGAYQSARNSLTMNCIHHPKVLEICESLPKDGDLNPVETEELGKILGSAAPVKRAMGDDMDIPETPSPSPEKTP